MTSLPKRRKKRHQNQHFSIRGAHFCKNTPRSPYLLGFGATNCAVLSFTGQQYSQSNEVFSRTLASSDLRVGQQVLLTWPPGRRCVIRYEGYGIFRVIEAHRTKLNSGDTFRCHLMVEHQPLILVELVHNGEKNIQYVAASKDGISFEILD